MLHHFGMIQSRVSNTHREHAVWVWCQCVNGFPFWIERERGNECVHVSKCLSPNRADFLCSGPNHIRNGKKAQEARKIAIITEHTQFVVFLFLFRIKKNQHRNFVDQTPSFVYLHSWHWVALAVDDGVVVVGIIIVIVVAAVVAHSKHQRHAQTHILLEFL